MLYSNYLLIAQSPVGSHENTLNKAFKFFQSKEYKSVISILKNQLGETISERYLLEISRLKTGEDNTKELAVLATAHPNHPLNSLANFSLGEHYFFDEDWHNTRTYLKSLDSSDLAANARAQYYFMLGYLNLLDKNYQRAESYFERSQTLTLSKHPKLTYYQGFVSYHLNKKEEALSYFKKVVNDESFGTSAKFFVAKMKLDDGDFQEVISMSQSEINDSRTETNAALYQLIGEAYAKQGQTNKASVYLERAIDLFPGRPEPALFYQAGVAKFKSGYKEKAIDYLTEAGIGPGQYAQLSAFQLARLYVSNGEFEKALLAYIEASQSPDTGIREEAIFQSGKLQIKQQNYSGGINYLNDYKTEFGNGKWIGEVQELLPEAFLRTSNYDQAIAHLKEVGIHSQSQKLIYQKVTFLKSRLLFNDGKDEESIRWLNESVKFPIDPSLSNEAYFMMAEAYFNLSDFRMSIRSYKAQKRPKSDTFYGLGYAHYNLFEYNDALVYFEQFVKVVSASEARQDAMLRLADCLYATKSYDQALIAFQGLKGSATSPYIQYRMGLIHQNTGRKSEAVQSYQRVLNMGANNFEDDALFNLALLRFESAEFDRAEFQFGSLISKYPTSQFIPEAYLNRAICRVNLNKLEDAKYDYKYVLSNYTHTKKAFNAILGLQELEEKGVAIKNLNNLIEQYKEANPDSKSLEVVEYESAKSQYFKLNYEVASVALKKFIKEHPRSADLSEAKYYLADSYYRNGQLEKSEEQFDEIKTIQHNLTGRILSRLGEINSQLGNYDKAIATFMRLKSAKLTAKDTYNGTLGLMNAYYKNYQFDDCIYQVNEIINADWKPLNAERNAILMKAKCLMQKQEDEKAKKLFETVADDTDAISAEASYYMGLLAFNATDYRESLGILFDLNSKFSSYAEWIDQSYLLIADDYLKMNEFFQAKATLRSIIQHSKNEEIKEIASDQLNQIETQVLQDSLLNKE